MKWIFKLFFQLKGWKVVGEAPKLKKYVMLAAPHTSNWDFIYALAAFYILDIPVKYTIKKELFFFPLGMLLRVMGGIAIDRNNKGGMVGHMVELFTKKEELVILITPEGTRSYSPQWKKGFYYVALGANLPVVLGYLDYGKKHAGIGPVIYLSLDFEGDIEKMKEFYRNIQPRFPEKGVK